MPSAIIGLGSNLGSREALLRAAIRVLDTHPGIEVVEQSRLYKSPALLPEGGAPQPDHLNAALRLEVALAPRALLTVMQRVEQRLGRERRERWGPRTLDLDLLHWSEGPVDEVGLTVPHPGLEARGFALAPLLDVAPELADRYASTLAALRPPLEVIPWAHAERTEDGLEVHAVDDADALALGLDAWLGGAVTGPTFPVAASDAAGFAQAVRGAALAVITSWGAEMIHGLRVGKAASAPPPIGAGSVRGGAAWLQFR